MYLSKSNFIFPRSTLTSSQERTMKKHMLKYIIVISQKSVIMSLWVFKSYLTAVGEHGRDEIDD
jgi:hypothetical protein